MISLLRGFFARPAPPPDDWPRTPDEMRASILARLEEDLPRASAHPDARLHWIADHLFLYVRRLEGFVSPEGAGLPHADVIDSTLYRVIRSGIEAFEVEMDRGAPAPAVRDAIERFRALWEEMGYRGDLSSRHDLLRLAVDLCDLLRPPGGNPS